MTTGVAVIVSALGYVGALFLLAWFGDRGKSALREARPVRYALALAVYCTSWTFFGSVGLAATSGYDFLPVYVGGLVVFGLAWRLVEHIVRVAKAQNLTSVADFLSARYGKSPGVAVVATLIAVVATLPYIALQLKAIMLSLDILIGPDSRSLVDSAFIATLLLALFALLFGTRHADTTQHQDGLMLAIATESAIKLVAFMTVGSFVLVMAFSSPSAFLSDVSRHPALSSLFLQGINWQTWLTVSFLSCCAILLLPRQFHVAVVENRHPDEIRTARWLFPLYLVLINLFVLPIAAAGILILPRSTSADTFVLALPLALQSPTVALIAFLGGLSAATAMIIVDSIAVSIMIANSIVSPVLLRSRRPRDVGDDVRTAADMAGMLLIGRRIAIVVVMLLGFGVYRLLEAVQGLAGIGLVSFAAVAQLAPAFMLGLLWRGGTAGGAMAGMCAGFAVWLYTLVTPWVVQAGLISKSVLTDGPFGLAVLRPQALFYSTLDPLTHGVLVSLLTNTAIYLIVSLQRRPRTLERRQAEAFVLVGEPTTGRPSYADGLSRWSTTGTTLTVAELEATIARYLGAERTARVLREFEAVSKRTLDPERAVDPDLTNYAELVLTSAVGAAPARLIMALTLSRNSVDDAHALKLLDDATEALQHNRALLHSALDQVRHGLAVFDDDARLVSWNRQFRDMLELPAAYGQVGVPLRIMLERVAQHKGIPKAQEAAWIADRIARLQSGGDPYFEHMRDKTRILEVRSAKVPQGGFVATFADVTERKLAADALEAANLRLERGIEEATRELQLAKEAADRASEDKTRFLATASHDVMQPLNAARLYTSSLVERVADTPDVAAIVKNLDQSLEAVEEILGTLVDIARLDAGRMTPRPMAFPLNELLEQLKVEFIPLAKERKLELRVVPTTVWVDTDRQMLRRVLQNLIANALKYTRSGGVVFGARRLARRPGETGAGFVMFQVSDTGPGIPEAKQGLIFQEFQRLPENAGEVAGLGLGLSIVERITRALGTPLTLKSRDGAGRTGSTFCVRIPRTAPMADELRPVPAGSGYAQIKAQFGGLTVLVVDNEQSVLDSMETLLLGWGCNVHKAKNTKEALRVMFSGEVVPDLVLADYHLDLGTGLDVVRTIRVRLASAVPAAIVTADNSREVQEAVRLAQCTYLKKPVRAAALRALVSQLTLKHAAE
jgi:Na+/proline symporter/signal transduction histidine kinase/ActR/RegA family two-component response regulator